MEIFLLILIIFVSIISLVRDKSSKTFHSFNLFSMPIVAFISVFVFTFDASRPRENVAQQELTHWDYIVYGFSVSPFSGIIAIISSILFFVAVIMVIRSYVLKTNAEKFNS